MGGNSKKALYSTLPGSSEGDFGKELWLTEELLKMLTHSAFSHLSP